MLAPPELSEPLGLSAAKISDSCACAGAKSTKHGSTREMRIERTKLADVTPDKIIGTN
jgi:hypothetical protein